MSLTYPGSDITLSNEATKLVGTTTLPEYSSLTCADSLAYILFAKTDLQLQRTFLQDFGMVEALAADNALYMRGLGASPYIYAAYSLNNLPSDVGQPVDEKHGFVGIGLTMSSYEELTLLSDTTGVAITNVDGPGGGRRVRLRDPDGFIVDAVWGRESVPRLATDLTDTELNTPDKKNRINRGVRPPLAPSPIEKLGHCVLSVSNFNKSFEWYVSHFGFIPTDVQCLEDGTPVLSFNRFNRGPEPADHHALVLMQNTYPKYMHSAYETTGLDAIGQGQQYLYTKGWKHFWGIGRHILGSQLFDYWLDPDGAEMEHYADGDVFDNTVKPEYHLLDIAGLWAWGDTVPNAMRPRLTLKEVYRAIKAVRKGNLTTQMLGLMKKAMGNRRRPWLK